MKIRYDQVTVAILAGHGSHETAQHHYARSKSGWPDLIAAPKVPEMQYKSALRSHERYLEAKEIMKDPTQRIAMRIIRSDLVV